MGATSTRLPRRFETDRLILRCYTEDDASQYYAASLRNRDHLLPYESSNVLRSLTCEEHARRTLHELAMLWSTESCYFIGAFEKHSGDFVGQVYVGLFREDPAEFIVGYIVDCLREGKGYITEAVGEVIRHVFDDLGAERIRIHCSQSNFRSRRVAERCGFQEESKFLEERPGPDGVAQEDTTIVYVRLLNAPKRA